MVIAQDPEEPAGMHNFDILVISGLFRDEYTKDLKVIGKRFDAVSSAHNDWVQVNSLYPSLKHIGCYEARRGLVIDFETYDFARVVGKCFPFHMVLDFSPIPFDLTNPSDQWWTLVRLKHTCPPVTFADD